MQFRSVAAGCPPGPAALARRQDRSAGAKETPRACRSLLISRSPCRTALRRRRIGRARRHAAACKFLFFSGGVLSGWSSHGAAGRPDAATQHSLVNISENTSAGFVAGAEAGTELIEFTNENGAHARMRCNTSAQKTSRATSEVQAGTRGRGTRHRAVPRRRRPGQRRDGCGFWIASSPFGLLAMTPMVHPRPAPAIVNRCRSLLIARIPGAAEPVRSGGSPGPRDGLKPLPPPPSPREESGERP